MANLVKIPRNPLDGWTNKSGAAPLLKPQKVQDAVDRILKPNTPSPKSASAAGGRITGSLLPLSAVVLAAGVGANRIYDALKKLRRQEDETSKAHGSPEKLGARLRAMTHAKRTDTAERIRKATATKK